MSEEPHNEESKNPPTPYTRTYTYKRRYMGGSKKPSIDIDMNKDRDIEETEDKAIENPDDFSEKPRTVVSVHPDDIAPELGYSQEELPIKESSETKSENTNLSTSVASDSKPEPTIKESPEEQQKIFKEKQFKKSEPVIDEPPKSKASAAEKELDKLKGMLQKKASEKKLNKNFTFFTGLIGFCAFIVAGCAAFFSVRGIALLFSGAMIGVLVMASSLEIAKLVTASFLYRYWRQLKLSLKVYLTTAVVILIGITSLGIFGYLSDAFETTKNRVQNYELQIEKLEGDIDIAESKVQNITTAKTVVDERSDEAVDDYKQIYDDFVERKDRDRVQIRNRISELDSERAAIEAQGGGLFSNKKKKLEELEARQLDERAQLNQSLQKIDQEIDAEYKLFIEKVNTYKSSLVGDTENDDKQKLDNLSTEINTKRDKILELKELISGTDIGSFKFIARAFNMDLEDVVKYFILFLVVVFDPLAVTLVLAYNIALLNKQDQ